MAQAILLKDVEDLGERRRRGRRLARLPAQLPGPRASSPSPRPRAPLEEAQRRRERGRGGRPRGRRSAPARPPRCSRRPCSRSSHRAGEDGKLFGSVTTEEIAEAIPRPRGLKVDRKKIRLDEPIRETGTYMVEVEVGGGATAKVKTIVAEAK